MVAELFAGFDFSLLESPDFKEDSVREEIVLPLLHALGYAAGGLNQIIRSKSLQHPLVNIGSGKRKINLIPDYLLAVGNKPAWILDAKAPDEEIASGENVEQAYSYAIHPEVRVKTYALCNGREFIAFDIDQKTPITYFHISEIDQHWQGFYDLLCPLAFDKPKTKAGKPAIATPAEFDYSKIRPLPEIKDLKKQSAKRHFGVHPYFTKQVWNVVQEYIKNFTRPGDVVLDPYGGSGVTLVEALILGRKAIDIDINPLSIFIVENLISVIDIETLGKEFARIRKEFERNAPRTGEEIEAALKKYPYPKGVELPKDADVATVEQLFSPIQLAQLV